MLYVSYLLLLKGGANPHGASQRPGSEPTKTPPSSPRSVSSGGVSFAVEYAAGLDEGSNHANQLFAP
jgi:hypothetical protein